jgi:gliding motility-associated-like protein
MRNTTINAFRILFLIIFFLSPFFISGQTHHNHEKTDFEVRIPFSFNNKWGYLNAKNEIAVEAKYDSVFQFKEGIGMVKLDAKYYLIGLNGDIIKQITPPQKPKSTTVKIPNTKQSNPSYRAQSTNSVCFPNFDFEDGNFNNWETNTGKTTDDNISNIITQDGAWLQNVNDPGPPNRHQLIDRLSNSGFDYYGGFPTNHPRGGRFGLKLGSNEDDIASSYQWPNRRTESVRYKIKVPNKDYALLVSYAVVFEYPQNGSFYCSNTHCDIEQPRFKAVIYKPNGDTLQCFNFSFVASDPNLGFQTSLIPGNLGSQVKYTDWTDVFINLSKFQTGDEVYLEITSADCTLGGHWGYGYFDVIECNYKLQIQNSCRTPKKTILAGPNGPFKEYIWKDKNNNVLSNKKIDSIPALPDNTEIKLILVPFPNFGCQDTIPALVVAPSPPTLDLVPNQPNCGKKGVIIGIQPNNNYEYSWNPNYNLSSINTSQVTANPDKDTTYKLTITDKLTGCLAIDSIKILNKPAVKISVNSDITCINKPVKLTANGATSYSWSPADGLSSTIGSSVNASPLRTTTYTIIGKNSTTSCEDTAFATVTIKQSRQISGRPVNPTDCNAIIGSIIIESLEPNITYWIYYTKNGVPLPKISMTADITGQIEIKNLGVGTYTNIYAEEKNSTQCATNIIGPYKLIGPDIPKKPKIQAPKLLFCPGDPSPPIQFISTDNSTFEWKNSNPSIGLPATGTGQINSFTPTNNTSDTLYATIIVKALLNGCPGPSDTVKIKIIPPPKISINGGNVCIGKSLNLTASGGSTYTWTSTPADPSINITNNGAIANVTPTVNTTYSAKGTEAVNGCSAIANSSVTVFPLPTGTLKSGGVQMVCENAQKTLEVTGTQNGTTYQWLLNGQVIPGATGPTILANQEGFYSIKLTSNFGCEKIAQDTVDLQQYKTPIANFTAPVGCIGNPVIFENRSNVTRSGTVSWEWDFGNGNRSFVKDPTYTYNQAGFYTVRLTVRSITCPGLNTTYELPVLIQEPLPGIRYTTIGALENTNVQLEARNIGSFFEWNPSIGLNDAKIRKPIFNYDKDTEYLIQITTTSGCKTTDTILLRVHKKADVFVPTAFSPNNDGQNDFLDVFTQGISKIHFWVFNRWGQLMFETTDPLQRWDGRFNGKPQPLENYVWIAEAETYTGERFKKRGQTILIR